MVGVTSDGVTQGGENSKYVADMVTQLVGKYLSESLETDDSNIREAMQNAIDRANEDILAITGDSTGFNGSSTAGIYVLDTTENMLHTATIADSVILVVDRSVSKAYVASKIVDINRNDVYEGIATGYTFQTAKSPQVQDMFSSQQARAQYASFHLSPGRDFVILSGSDHLQSLVGWELVKPADGNNKTREFDIAVKGQYVSVRNPVSGKIESRKAIGLLRWVLGTQFEVPTVMMNRISKAFETNRGDDLGIIIEDVRGGGTLKPNQTVRINTIDAAITSEGPKKFIIGSGEFVNIFLPNIGIDQAIKNAHGTIHQVNNRWFYEPYTGSLTKVNTKDVTDATELHKGDTLQLGDATITVSLDSDGISLVRGEDVNANADAFTVAIGKLQEIAQKHPIRLRRFRVQAGVSLR